MQLFNVYPHFKLLRTNSICCNLMSHGTYGMRGALDTKACEVREHIRHETHEVCGKVRHEARETREQVGHEVREALGARRARSTQRTGTSRVRDT